MKKVLSYILISFIILVNLLAPISVGWGSKNGIKIQKNKTEAATDCVINSATWSPDGGSTVTRPNSLILNIKTTNCEGKTLTVLLNETGGINKPISTISGISLTSGDFSINYKPGEVACDNSSCEINYSIFLRNPDSIFGEIKSIQNVPYIYQCSVKQGSTKPTCDDTLVWKYTLPTETEFKSDYSFDISPIIQASNTSVKVDLDVKNSNQASASITAGTVIAAKLNIKVDLLNKDGTTKETQEQEMPAVGGIKNFLFNSLTSDTDYIVEISIIENSTISSGVYSSNNNRVITTVPAKNIHTNVAEKQEFIDQGPVNNIKMNKIESTSNLPACSVDPISKGTFMGCVVQAFYYILYVPTSYLFALAGTIFDYTFNYSVQDTSYRSAFVVEGWGLVRDFCNMFFIFIMLYVAIGTILSLHNMKTKETIINVVIIGLFINFSLFATQIIIDASNITARVFYNADAIKITEKGANGVAKATPGLNIGADGVIPLSAALVNKVNPQNLIMSADKVKSIPNNSTNGVTRADNDDKSLGVAQFILIIIMASAVNIVGFTVFLTVGFLFIARVVGLWIAMILAPLAFFTYILPEMAGVKMIGWKNWWGDTLRLAFLAPVFIFFMYIILKFLQADLITDIAGKSMTGDGLGYFASLLIPFAFIMILLIKAKKIAIDMSGEFGEMAVKAGSAVGGMALGGAVGVGAMAMRGTIGKVGDKLDKASWVNNMAGSKNKLYSFLGNKLKDTGQGVAGSSFDVRNTVAGAAAGKGMGSDIGKGKTGGYTKDRKDFVERKQKRANEIKVNEDEELTQNINKLEMDLQSLLRDNAHELDTLDKRIKTAREDAADINSKDTTDPIKVAAKKAALAAASAMSTATPDDVAKKTAAIAAANAMDVDDTAKVQAKKDANDKVTELKANKKAIKTGILFTQTALTAAPGTTPGVLDYTGVKVNGKTIDNLETDEIPHAKDKKEKESRRRTTNFANNSAFWGSATGKETQHKIIMETKIESSSK